MRGARPKRWFFDVWAVFYDLPWVQRAVYRPPHDAVLAELGPVAGAVLDLGCGTGQLAARIHRESPGARVVGCDFSHGMLARARARDRGMRWVQGDAGRLPFRDGSFDAVVSTEAFHWFPDKPRALAEIRRVLRPGGRLLLALVNPRLAVTGRVMQVASRLVGEPFYWPTSAEMRRTLAAAGFHVERQTRIFRLPAGVLFPPVLTVASAGGPRRASVEHFRHRPARTRLRPRRAG